MRENHNFLTAFRPMEHLVKSIETMASSDAEGPLGHRFKSRTHTETRHKYKDHTLNERLPCLAECRSAAYNLQVKAVRVDLDNTLHEFRRSSGRATNKVLEEISERYGTPITALKEEYSTPESSRKRRQMLSLMGRHLLIIGEKGSPPFWPISPCRRAISLWLSFSGRMKQVL